MCSRPCEGDKDRDVELVLDIEEKEAESSRASGRQTMVPEVSCGQRVGPGVPVSSGAVP